MRSPLPALQAFSRDAVETTSAAHDTDPRLTDWLAVTKAAERLCTMQQDVREPYLSTLALTVLPPSSARPTLRHDVLAAPAEPVARLAERLRVEAEDMERAGCFEMAFATVAAVCRLSKEADLVSQLVATAHLGRIARQLGDSASAADCYECVVSEASRVRDGPLGALGVLGLGNLARSRGNRPEERRLFNVALSLAHIGGTCELSAQQGLMNVALSDNRLPEALLHGWRAFDLSEDGSDARAMALSNLAFAALRGNFAGAALSGFLHVLTLSHVVRIRLLAVGGAMRAAADRGDRWRVTELGVLGDEESARANVPFVVAGYAVHAGLAWQTLGKWDDAVRLFSTARALAAGHGFHEILASADRALTEIQRTRHGRVHYADTTDATTRQQPDALVPDGIRRLEALAA